MKDPFGRPYSTRQRRVERRVEPGGAKRRARWRRRGRLRSGQRAIDGRGVERELYGHRVLGTSRRAHRARYGATFGGYTHPVSAHYGATLGGDPFLDATRVALRPRRAA